MLAHALHLLLPLLHVVLRIVGVVRLLQLLPEQDPHLVLVPLSVAVQVVHREECPGVPVLTSIEVLTIFYVILITVKCGPYPGYHVTVP